MNSNPSAIATAAAELPQPARFTDVKAAQAYLTANNISYVLAQFVDIHGEIGRASCRERVS
jgi:glutamine synthetase